MFDQETIQLLARLPAVRELSGESAREYLTQAYLEIIRLRLSDNVDLSELPDSLNQARQMANSLELYCLIEFAREQQLTESGRAAAFVAAQSLELLAELPKPLDSGFRHVLANPQTMSLIESGLLYLISGYYANALTVRRKLPPPSEANPIPLSFADARQASANSLLGLLRGLIGLDVGAASQYDPAWPSNIPNTFTMAPADLSASAEGKLLSQLGVATAEYLGYLAGEQSTNTSAIDTVIDLIEKVSQAMQPDSQMRPSAESLLPFHLASILEIVFRDLSSFATVHNILPPQDSTEDYQAKTQLWLKAKARRRHALLWHSTKKWLDTRRNEEAAHTVVSMPTGSGKSFLAELALVDRLDKGWGLYIAPMNALVRQIQQDLERELGEIDIRVRRFLTDEHTTLKDEIFAGAAEREVVIMTPEKALLAIRLKPEAFRTCTLCVFDECHILAKDTRGAASDDLLSRLLIHAPDVHVMLLSAMIQNPERLADWLHNVTGKASVPVSLNWKPTRSLRTLAVVPHEDAARLQLDESRTCSARLLGQASIAWQGKSDALSINSRLPELVKVRRHHDGFRWEKSVNATATQIGAALAKQHISTVVFLNTNATHVFAQARDAPNLGWIADQDTPARWDKTEAWLGLAKAELGSLSPLVQLHPKGITVHSGALIDEEKRAAEMAYKQGLVGLMIATGTLAQGLNFPGQAVVMAGIKGNRFVGERSPADILNAFGRSGRAGFHNIGLSILVPKQVFTFVDEGSFDTRSEEYELLRKHDACLDVDSALSEKVDRLIAAANLLDETGKISPNDLETATLIADMSKESSTGSFFRHTFAAHLAESSDYVDDGMKAAQKLVDFFFSASPSPDWMPELAQRAGLSVAWMTQFHQAIVQTISLESVKNPQFGFSDALSILQEAIKQTDPIIMVDKLDGERGKTGTTQLRGLPTKLRGKDFDWMIDLDSPSFSREKWQNQWDEVFDMLMSWLRGDTFYKIAVEYFGLPDSSLPMYPDLLEPSTYSRSDQSPMNRAIKSVRDISYPLRHLSSGLVQLITKMMQEAKLIVEEEEVPLHLGMLPQAIHWGVDRLDKAFWYYNLLPVRSVAHACGEAFPIEFEDDTQIRLAVSEAAIDLRANPERLRVYSSDRHAETLKAAAQLLR